MIKNTIILYGQPITYTVNPSPRARRLAITIACDAAVTVTAPLASWSEEGVEEFFRSHAQWVLAMLRRVKKAGPRLRLPGGRREYLEHKETARAFVHKKLFKLNQLYNFSYRSVAIRHARSRWGSCSRRGNLNFNYKILFLPERLAEYVVAHELAHLEQFNHSARFWELVARTVPEHRALRGELRRVRL